MKKSLRTVLPLLLGVVALTIIVGAAVLLFQDETSELPERESRPVRTAPPAPPPETKPEGQQGVDLRLHLSVSNDTDWAVINAVVLYSGDSGRDPVSEFPYSEALRERRLDPSEEEAGLFQTSSLPTVDEYIIVCWKRTIGYYTKTVKRDGESLLELNGSLSQPAGIQLLLDGPKESFNQFVIRLARTDVDADDSVAWSYLIWKTDPELFRSYNWMPDDKIEGSRKLLSDGVHIQIGEEKVLAPLIPDSTVDLRLVPLSGDAILNRKVQLEPGELTTTEFILTEDDLSHLEPCIMLRGRIVSEKDERPFENARVIYADVELDFRESVTDKQGEFELPCLPQGQDEDHGHGETPIRVILPAIEEGLAPYPLEMEFQAHLNDVNNGALDIEWKVPALYWLDVRITDWSILKELTRGQGYPKYMLERWDQDSGGWTKEEPSEFAFREKGVALGIEGHGRVRGLAELSPLSALRTESVELGDETSIYQLADFPVGETDTLNIRLKSHHDGSPLSGVEVQITPETAGDGSLEATSDGEGLIRVEGVSIWPVNVQIGTGEHSQAKTITREEAQSTVEITVSAP